MRRHSKWWIAVAALVVCAAGFWLWKRQKSAAQGQAAAQKAGEGRAVPVIAAEVEKKDVPIWLDGLGTVIAWRTVTIRTQVDGRLDSIGFKEGQLVKKGDLLAQIDPRPFEIQLQQAQGALARDSAQLRAASLQLVRDRELLAQQLVSQAEVDAQAALAGQAQGAVKIDESQVSAARLNLSYARITSPLDGVTGIRNVDAGNFVRASDTAGLVVVTQLDPVAVLFTLAQELLPQITEAQRGGPLEVEVFSRDAGERLGAGQLELVDNQIVQQTATLRLKAVLPNAERRLWPNAFVKARLRVAVRKDALVVPATAVQRGPDGTFAWVVQADQTVVNKPVQVDRTQGDSAILTSGLGTGDLVVTDGVTGLRAGAKVQAQKRDKPAQPRPREGAPAQPQGRDPGTPR